MGSEERRITTRKQAMSSGEKQYFTGKPCPHGHVDYRHTVNGGCTECSRIKALKRMRENPKARAASRESQKARYHSDKEYQEKIKERSRLWYENNKQKASENKKSWYERNKTYAQKTNKERWENYRKNEDWVKRERKRKIREYKMFPERQRASHNARRAREKFAEGKLTAKDIINILSLQGHRCAYCKTCIKRGYEMDHNIPISKGGSNWPSNIQGLCRSCNRRKSAKDPLEFAQEMGMLL